MSSRIGLLSCFLLFVVALDVHGQTTSEIDTSKLIVISAENVLEVEQLATIELDGYVHDLSWSADNVRLASGVQNEVIVFNVHSGEKREIDHTAYGLFFAPNNRDVLVVISRTLAASYADTLLLLDLKTNLETTIELPFIYAGAFSSNGSLFAVSHAVDLNERIVLFETESWKQVGLLQLERDYSAMEIAFSPNNRWLATINAGGGGYLWDVQKALDSRLMSFEDAVKLANLQRTEALAFSPDGILAIAYDIFRLSPEQETAPQLELRRISERNDAPIISLVWSAQHSIDKTDELRVINDLAFTPNGELLIAATEEGQLQFWSVSSGDLLFRVQESQSPIRDVAVNPASTMIATTQENIVTLWGISG